MLILQMALTGYGPFYGHEHCPAGQSVCRICRIDMVFRQCDGARGSLSRVSLGLFLMLW